MTGPRLAHFVYGFRPQTEPFAFLHYVAIESCRRVVRPDRILVHCDELPYGVFWDRIRPHVELHRVERVAAVTAVEDDDAVVPRRYRYAHHADVVRLEALIRHGGLYADIDTVFLRPLPDRLWRAPFVIGAEGDVADAGGVDRPSLCNALLMAQPDSTFARTWLERIPEALDGTWSNHSGFLARELADRPGAEVVVEPSSSFFPVLFDPASVRHLLTAPHLELGDAYSLHLWAHLWWEEGRRDHSDVHGGSFTPDAVAAGTTGLCRLVAPYLPEPLRWPPAGGG